MLFSLWRVVKQKLHNRFCISISLTWVIQLSDLGLKNGLYVELNEQTWYFSGKNFCLFTCLAFCIFSLKKHFFAMMPLRRTIFVAGRPGRDSSCFDYVRFCLKFNSVGGHECKPEMKHLLLEQLPPCFVSFSCCTSSQPTCIDQKFFPVWFCSAIFSVHLPWGPAVFC